MTETDLQMLWSKWQGLEQKHLTFGSSDSSKLYVYETQIRLEMFNKLESTKYHSLTQQLINTTYTKSAKDVMNE